MKYLPSSSFIGLCLPENIAANIESGSPLVKVSILVSNCTPPTLSLTIFGIPLFSSEFIYLSIPKIHYIFHYEGVLG
ncbi:MAG: hypothetical protein ACK55Z_04030, partial [bacterium]